MKNPVVPKNLDRTNDPKIYKTWALQDYLLLTSLLELQVEELCSISWRSFIGKGGTTGAEIESFSAIIDKLGSIPKELFDEQMAYANSFVATQVPCME